MSRVAKIYTAKEILKTLEKQWLTTKDIQIVSGSSQIKAREIKKNITAIILQEGNYLPQGLVPVDRVIKYLNINVNYLKKIANI